MSDGRVCTKCGEFKSFENFPKMQGGYRPRCKPCHVEDSSAWAKKNHGRYIKRLRAWYDANRRRPRVLLTAKEKAERKRAYNTLWAQKNKDRFKEMRRAWVEKNKHVEMERVRRRQIAKHRATTSWGDKEKIKAFYKRAAELSQKTGTRWSVDHIVPIKSKLVCGLHVEHNLQLLPFSENARKGNHYWPGMP